MREKYLRAYQLMGISRQSARFLFDLKIFPADYVRLVPRMQYLLEKHDGVIPLINVLHPNCELRRTLMLYCYRLGLEDAELGKKSYYKFTKK